MKKSLLAFFSKIPWPVGGLKGFLFKMAFKYIVIPAGQFIVFLAKQYVADQKQKADEIKKEKYENNLKDGVTEDESRDSITDLIKF